MGKDRERIYYINFPPILGEEEKREVMEVLDSKILVRTYGIKAFKLEEELSNYFNVGHVITCNSGTSALHLALAALDIGPGDEVIVPPIGFITSSTSVLYQNAIPIFADVDEYGMLDPEDIRTKISDKTRAIIVVHLMGHAAQMDAIMEIAKEHSIYLIEDAAQAIGARYKGRLLGTLGDVGCFSLHQSKVITSGEGGFVITDNDRLAEKIYSISNFGRPYGIPHAYSYVYMGYNYRIPEISAAIALAQMRSIDKFIAGRKRNAAYLTKKLSGIEDKGIRFLKAPPWSDSVWWTYILTLEAELKVGIQEFISLLFKKGVGAMAFDKPDNLQEFYLEKKIYPHSLCPFSCPYYGRDLDYSTMCPKAEKLLKSRVGIPGCEPHLNKEDLDYIASAIKDVISKA